MALDTFNVHIEKATETPLGELMKSMRLWLDQQKIQPAEFKSSPADPGVIAIDVRFNSEDEARRFEQEFA